MQVSVIFGPPCIEMVMVGDPWCLNEVVVVVVHQCGDGMCLRWYGLTILENVYNSLSKMFHSEPEGRYRCTKSIEMVMVGGRGGGRKLVMIVMGMWLWWCKCGYGGASMVMVV